MSRKKVLTGAFIILITSIITRVLGFVFRVYISNRLGAEGIGLYQLVLSLYMLIVTFATSGITIAVSRMTAEQQKANLYGSTRTVLVLSIKYSLCISIAATIILFVFAQPLGNVLLSDQRTALSLKFLAPGLPFMAVSACIKGYYYALQDSIRPSSAQVIEQIAKMTAGILLLQLWLPLGETYACAATALGMTIGEFISCSYVLITYYHHKQNRKEPISNRRRVLRQILAICIPIQSSSTFHSILRLAENLLILYGLRIYAYGNASAAISVYGIIKGMVIPLLLFPTSLLQALVTTLIPEVAGARASGNNKTVTRAVNKVLQLTIMMSVLIVSIFLIFPNQIGVMLYHEALVGAILAKLSLICPLMYLEMVTIGILNAIGQQTAPMRYNIIDSILRIILIFFFVPRGGINAFLIIMIFSNLFTSVLNLKRLLKVTNLTFQWKHWVFMPSLAAASAGLSAKLLFFLFPYQMYTWQTFLICISLIGAVYILLLFALRCITRRDIQWVKGAFT